MKKINKSVFFIVLSLILLFSCSVYFGVHTYYGDIRNTYVKGLDEIRLGIDVQGGVDVTFTPEDGMDATDQQMDAAMEVIKQRMASLNINDNEIYVDYDSDRIIVRFPWQAGEENFDPEHAVKELGETALLTFREGMEVDDDGLPIGVTKTNIILQGKDIKEAFVTQNTNPTTQVDEIAVALNMDESGKQKFADATGKLAPTKGVISIWMDDVCVSYPSVSNKISDGKAIITSSANGGYTYEEAKSLADKINSGALPFKLVTASFRTISPTMGAGALQAMIISGIIAFVVIAIYMTFNYRLPGFVASLALIGQVAGTLAAVSGYFGFSSSSTLTIPGMAGIILAVGMGVDANIITAERIKEEVNSGKSLNRALSAAYKRAFSAILDGNLTQVIVAVILMGAFGIPSSIFAKIFNFIFFMFGPSTEGVIYSFGFTLLSGVLLNFVMGVFASRLMLTSLSKFKVFSNKKLYGGKTNE